MQARHLLILSILVAAFARADVPDVTASLEYVSNPAMHRWPANSYPRGALDLQFHCGTLLVGAYEPHRDASVGDIPEPHHPAVGRQPLLLGDSV